MILLSLHLAVNISHGMHSRFILILFFLSIAFPSYLQKPARTQQPSWERVEALLKEGRPASALPLAESLLHAARAKNDPVGVVRALFYIFRSKEVYTEDAYEEFLRITSEEIRRSHEPLTQVLHSLRGQLLWTYFLNQQWLIRERRALIDSTQEDPRFWDSRRFMEEIQRALLLSLRNEALLKKITREKFEGLLTGDRELYYLYPTLFDFLAFRAFEFLSHAALPNASPQEFMILSDVRLWGTSESFAGMELPDSTPATARLQALSLLQNLTRFHLEDTDPGVLTAVDLMRFRFLNAHGTMPRKPWLYKAALEKIIQARPLSRHTAEAGYLLARWYYEEGQKWQPAYGKAYDSTASYWILAERVCEATFKTFPKTPGGTLCKALWLQLRAQPLNLTLPRLTRPLRPTLAALSYKNTDAVQLLIYKTTSEAWERFEQTSSPYDRDQAAKFFSALPLVHREEIKLPADTLLHTHTTYLKIPALEEGFYIVAVVADRGGNFLTDKKISTCFAPLSVTDLAWVTETQGNRLRVRVYKSLTDQPEASVKISVYQQVYNYQQHRYEKAFVTEGKTDRRGIFIFEAQPGSFNGYFYEIERRGLHLISEIIYLSGRREKSVAEKEVLFFTDRALYRPGQRLEFKALILSGEPLPQTRLMPEQPLTVELRDPNNRLIFEETYVSNAWGSVWGKVLLPSQGITGTYTLRAGRTVHPIQVEEYKMPRFEVKLSGPTTQGLIGETVTLEGQCLTLAGVPVTGSPVRYRVTRHLMQRWPVFRGGWPPTSRDEGEEVISGTLIPDEKGRFSFQFLASPDERIARDSSRIYLFMVYAECTDLTGETRTAERQLYFSHTPISGEIKIPDVYFKNRPEPAILQLHALNEAEASAPVRLTVRLLKPTGRIPLPNLLPPADVRLIPTSSFIKDFPHQLNAGETEDSLLTEGPVVIDTVFFVKDHAALPAGRIRALADGLYRMELQVIPEKGRHFFLSKRVTLVQSDEGTAYVFGPPLFVSVPSESMRPGEAVRISLAALRKCPVSAEIVDESLGSGWVAERVIGPDFSQVVVPGTESHEPGWRLLVTTCMEGRILQQTVLVNVSNPTRKIRLEWLDARDTVEPGQTYTWRFKATATDGTPVRDAEVLAVMYDAAVDHLMPSRWMFTLRTPPIPYPASRIWTNETAPAYGWQGERVIDRIREFLFPVLNTYDFYLAPFEDNYEIYGRGGIALTAGRMAIMEATSAAPGRTRATREKSHQDTKDDVVDTPNESTYMMDNNPLRPRADLSGGYSADLSPKVRRRFVETAFFIPDIYTDAKGEGIIRFTVPEQITGWTLRLSAHTQHLAHGLQERRIFSQKSLMINAFLPRFFREGDSLVLTGKITSLHPLPELVTAEMFCYDLESERLIKHWQSNKKLEVKPGMSVSLAIPFLVPSGIKAVKIILIVEGNRGRDAEEWQIPVLPSEVFITEAYPFHVKAGQKTEIKLEKPALWQAGKLPDVKPLRLTLEVTPNTLWLVVQSLPYLAEFPHACSEQLFARYFSYAVLRHLVSRNPALKKTLDYWKNFQPQALVSALEKNPTFKNIMLEETPWLRDAESETRRKQLLSALVDAVLNTSLETTTAEKLAERQQPDGGWPWFEGGPSSWFITQHITAGLGRMEHMGIVEQGRHPLAAGLPKAARFLDLQIQKAYENIQKILPKSGKEARWLQPIHAHYLFTRSLLPNIQISDRCRPAYEFFIQRARAEWQHQNPYVQALLALAFHRLGENELKQKIITSLREKAIRSEDYGMYWKGMMQGGWHWSEHPTEAMAVLMEAFRTAGAPEEELAAMQLWLLRHKQTNHWASTKATTEACFALLNDQQPLREPPQLPSVWLGDTPVSLQSSEAEAGTGYVQLSLKPLEIPERCERLKAEGGNSPLSWGSVYFQYHTPLDKVESSTTRFLSIDRQVWYEPAPGQALRRLEPGAFLKVGQRVYIRLRIVCSQPMDYVHIRDRRASAMEPEDLLSGFHWKEGLGFYQSTRDASTHFFVEHMPRGAFVFEYPVRITHAGHYSDGFAEIQCMYAPEFSAHSASEMIRTAEN